MNQQHLSDWPEEEKKAGEQFSQAWETFFANQETAVSASLDQTSEVIELQNRVQDDLMHYPNVVAVAEGYRTKDGKPTQERCLVVYVSKKVPRSKLKKNEVIPNEIDGIPLDVVEVGSISSLPA